MLDLWDDIDSEILDQRAKQLAKRIEDRDVIKEKITLLEFNLLGGSYAVQLSNVEAVMRIGDIFSVPLTPQHIPGVIRRRGQTIALVNLQKFFHPATEGLLDMDFAIICNVQGKIFAIQANEIEGVLHIEKELIQAPPDNFDRAQAPFLAGVTTAGLVILDLGRLAIADGFGTQNVGAQ